MTVLITGGGTGIGKGIAYKYAEKGYDVAITYRESETGAVKVVEDIKAMGRKAVMINADLSKYDEIINLFKEYRKHFDSLDVFINNAGVTKKASFLETTEEIFDEMCNVDFKGAYFCMQQAAKLMVEKKTEGNIIVISSNNADAVFADVSVYASTKAAVNKLVKHTAIELAKYNIRVNSVAPGWTDKGASRLDAKEDTYYKIPLKKWTTPEEVAESCLYLTSAKSVTGTTLVIDNGALLVSDKRERYGF